MELSILILSDALEQQKKQLKLNETSINKDNLSEKQIAFLNKGIENLKSFIAELESAITILKKATIETPSVNDNEVQKEDFCALLDELIVYGSNNGWWSRTIDFMRQLKQKYD